MIWDMSTKWRKNEYEGVNFCLTESVPVQVQCGVRFTNRHTPDLQPPVRPTHHYHGIDNDKVRPLLGQTSGVSSLVAFLQQWHFKLQ